MKIKQVTIVCILGMFLQVILFSNTVLALKKDGYIRKDYFDRNRKNVYDENGKLREYYKNDYFHLDRTNIYDPSGQKQGYLHKDYFLKDRINIYNQTGNTRWLS